MVKKIAYDQLIFAPCFLAVLVPSLNALKGQTFLEVKENMRNNYPDILVTNYKVGKCRFNQVFLELGIRDVKLYAFIIFCMVYIGHLNKSVYVIYSFF